MTRIIEIGGAPSAGKSTLAADLYARMSEKGLSVQLSREYACEYAARYGAISRYEHVAILGKQLSRITAFLGKVDYIISDSPLYLNAFYSSLIDDDSLTLNCVRKIYEQILMEGNEIIQINLDPLENIKAAGRIHSNSFQLDIDIDKFLDSNFSLDFFTKEIFLETDYQERLKKSLEVAING